MFRIPENKICFKEWCFVSATDLPKINGTMNSVGKNSKSQQRFIADASHELRTPITIIRGYADMLEKYGKEDEELFKESVGEIQKAAKNMQTLVESMLFLARADSGVHVLNKIKFDVGEVLRGLIATFNDPRIELNIDSPQKVFGDPEYLKIMFREFISNSLEYSDDNIKIEILNVDGRTQIKFIDSGIGISPENLERIFERFYRADKSRTKADESISAGLGLSIAKRIADAHEIKIEIDSIPDEGTTFTLIFPPIFEN